MSKPSWLTIEFIIYVLKCLLGLVLCYFFYWLFPEYRFYWSIVSVLLVISPDDLDCKKLPIDRMKANITGSLVGLLLFIIHPPNLLMMSIGVVTTILICYRIQLGTATRSALAALIIVLVQQLNDHSLISAFERMVSVVLGCLVALFITYLFEYNHKWLKGR
ncbi:MAG: FUSC family protein [Clostridiales bacterium]|uniref:FUSC family protein n=1 Tax=Zhenhengia sp. TaxID=2944208 RepID=UPI002911AF2C|nr:FUSC family protein [Clostridiales bacterium]